MAFLLILYLTLISSGLGLITHDVSFLESLKADLMSLEKCLTAKNVDVHIVVQEFHSCTADAIQPILSATMYGSRFTDPVVDAFCRSTDLVQCFLTTKDKIKMCLPKEREVQFDHTLTLFSNIITYACQNDGQPIKDLLTESSKTCLTNEKEEIDECLNKFEKYDKNKGLTHWFSQEFCEEQNKFFPCMIKALDSCEDKTPSKIFNDLFKIMYKDTPCTSCGVIINLFSLLLTYLLLLLNNSIY